MSQAQPALPAPPPLRHDLPVAVGERGGAGAGAARPRAPEMFLDGGRRRLTSASALFDLFRSTYPASSTQAAQPARRLTQWRACGGCGVKWSARGLSFETSEPKAPPSQAYPGRLLCSKHGLPRSESVERHGATGGQVAGGELGSRERSAPHQHLQLLMASAASCSSSSRAFCSPCRYGKAGGQAMASLWPCAAPPRRSHQRNAHGTKLGGSRARARAGVPTQSARRAPAAARDAGQRRSGRQRGSPPCPAGIHNDPLSPTRSYRTRSRRYSEHTAAYGLTSAWDKQPPPHCDQKKRSLGVWYT